MEILRRYPHLNQPPADSPLGQDTPLPPAPRIPFPAETTVIPPNPHEAKEKEEAEKNAQDEEEQPMTETWHDIALAIAAEMLQSARNKVRTELGYTTSAVSRASEVAAFKI
jgi:DNA polymerase eta